MATPKYYIPAVTLFCILGFTRFNFAQSNGQKNEQARNLVHLQSMNRDGFAVKQVGHEYEISEPSPPVHSNCHCQNCESNTCGHCPDDCPKSEKWIAKKLKKWGLLKCKDRRALGFCVEEVQYGANAGPPSFGFVSHAAWYTGPRFGPGSRLNFFKKLKLRRSMIKDVRTDDCGQCAQPLCDCESEPMEGGASDLFSPGMNYGSNYPLMSEPIETSEPAPASIPSPNAVNEKRPLD